jgi:hypothetical protein
MKSPSAPRSVRMSCQWQEYFRPQRQTAAGCVGLLRNTGRRPAPPCRTQRRLAAHTSEEVRRHAWFVAKIRLSSIPAVLAYKWRQFRKVCDRSARAPWTGSATATSASGEPLARSSSSFAKRHSPEMPGFGRLLRAWPYARRRFTYASGWLAAGPPASTILCCGVAGPTGRGEPQLSLVARITARTLRAALVERILREAMSVRQRNAIVATAVHTCGTAAVAPEPPCCRGPSYVPTARDLVASLAALLLGIAVVLLPLRAAGATTPMLA